MLPRNKKRDRLLLPSKIKRKRKTRRVVCDKKEKKAAS